MGWVNHPTCGNLLMPLLVFYPNAEANTMLVFRILCWGRCCFNYRFMNLTSFICEYIHINVWWYLKKCTPFFKVLCPNHEVPVICMYGLYHLVWTFDFASESFLSKNESNGGLRIHLPLGLDSTVNREWKHQICRIWTLIIHSCKHNWKHIITGLCHSYNKTFKICAYTLPCIFFLSLSHLYCKCQMCVYSNSFDCQTPWSRIILGN